VEIKGHPTAVPAEPPPEASEPSAEGEAQPTE
jgi:hypothetical protein